MAFLATSVEKWSRCPSRALGMECCTVASRIALYCARCANGFRVIDASSTVVPRCGLTDRELKVTSSNAGVRAATVIAILALASLSVAAQGYHGPGRSLSERAVGCIAKIDGPTTRSSLKLFEQRV